MRGSGLAKLHYDWRAGTTLRGAITSGRHLGLLGLACIFSTIVVIDGPLLQRASTVMSAPKEPSPVPLDVTIAPELPTDWSGWRVDNKDFGLQGIQSWEFNTTIPTWNGSASNLIGSVSPRNLSPIWYDDRPLSSIVRGCHGEFTLFARVYITLSKRNED